MKINISIILVPLFLLAACSSEQTPSLVGTTSAGDTGKGVVSLNPAQVNLYQDGLKKIITNPQSAEFKAVKAIQFPQKPGVHICGYVSFAKTDTEKTEVPFYVELRKEADQDIIHRGQVGTDPSKLSKVKFVCRHHESG